MGRGLGLPLCGEEGPDDTQEEPPSIGEERPLLVYSFLSAGT
jgi:hypothetical protein